MCGICGVLVTPASALVIDRGYLVAMRDTMAHRGPDGAGIWVSSDRRVGLGHRRLSIIDLSASADQPMASEDGTVQLIFNGEIYNHAEIRRELEEAGDRRWKTDHSDTEVVLHAFDRWGIDCLAKFRGMFAIALWDGRKRELWLIRDRIGIKPIYYTWVGGRLLFASEIKALLADPHTPAAVNERALFHYLSFITTPAPETLFSGIYKLPPATWMRIAADGSVRTQRYWDVFDHLTPLTDRSEDEVAALLIDELRTSVDLRKVADVPMGVFLSGGVDSSTNLALFAEGRPEPVHTFSIGYAGSYDSYPDELPYAREVARTFGAQYHERLLTVDDFVDFLPQMIHLQDEPIGDPVCVPVYYVSKLARDAGVIVAQVGEGSDELFFGYPAWKRALAVQNFCNLPGASSIAGLGDWVLGRTPKRNSLYRDWLRRAAMDQPVFWGGVDVFGAEQKNRILHPRLRERFAGDSSWEVIEPIYNRFVDKAWDASALNWMTYIDLNMRLPELLLMRVDKMSMGASLEARVPFLDHKFCELAMSIPSEMKLRNGNGKHILKKAVRGIIPDAIIDRKKQGFGAPIQDWFFEKLGVYARSELESFCRKTELLDWGEISTQFEAGRGGAKLWFLLNVALWWKQFIDTPRPAVASGTDVAVVSGT